MQFLATFMGKRAQGAAAVLVIDPFILKEAIDVREVWLDLLPYVSLCCLFLGLLLGF